MTMETKSRTLGHRAPLLWVLLPLMAGLVAGKLEWLPLNATWCASSAAVLLMSALVALIASFASDRRATRSRSTATVFQRDHSTSAVQRTVSVSLIAGMFLSGAAFYELKRLRLPDWDALPAREVRATLEIDRTFPPKFDARTISGLGRLLATDAHLPDLVGQPVYFSISLKRGQPAPIRSSQMELTGVLTTLPRSPANNTFDGYLAGQGMNFKFTRARITGASVEAGVYSKFCDAALVRFDEILGEGISHYPQMRSVLRAMLLGQQQELNDEQKNVFRQSGTMHLFSISGLHIALIAAAIHGVLLLCRLPPVGRFVIGGILLWLYVDITGGTPSAVRSFLMVVFLHGSHVLRVPGNPFSALVASALVVLVWQPLQLFSASFQLSYGIVAVLLLLGLPLGEAWLEKTALFTWLPKVSWRWWRHAADWSWRAVLGALSIGVATSTVSLISGVEIFGLFTPVGALANLVLIPIGSLVIISGFVSMVFGLFGLTWLVVVLNHASVLLLLITEKCVEFFVGLPGAHHAAEFRLSWLGYSAFAALLGIIFYGYAMDWEKKRGGFWPPFIFTALVLSAGMRWVVPPMP